MTRYRPRPFCMGRGSENFSMLAKRGGPVLFEFLGGGGGESKKEGVDFFRGEAEDFLKVIFSC